MDYSFTIAGTTDDDEEVLELVQEFVSELNEVTAASFSSTNFAHVDLTEEDDIVDETTAEPGDGNGSEEEAPAPAEPQPEEEEGKEEE
jgi:hypothetical protein